MNQMTMTHVVVDGSNIATEGRTAPSLAQLDEAVRSFLSEYGEDLKLTVVVDATFGHRISPDEKDAFDAGIVNGELVTPPAGAIGRGDAGASSRMGVRDADPGAGTDQPQGHQGRQRRPPIRSVQPDRWPHREWSGARPTTGA